MERPQKSTPRLNAIPDACEKLGGISRRKLYDLMDAGHLRSVKIGARRLVSDAAIAEYVERLDSAAGAA